MTNSIRLIGKEYLDIEMPKDIASGEAFNVTITAVDGYGTILSQIASATVNLEVLHDSGLLVPTPSSVVLINGTLTFSVTLDFDETPNAMDFRAETALTAGMLLDKPDQLFRRLYPISNHVEVYDSRIIIPYLYWTVVPSSTERNIDFTLGLEIRDQFDQIMVGEAPNLTLSIASSDILDSITNANITSGDWVNGVWSGTSQITGGSGDGTFVITANGEGFNAETGVLSLVGYDFASLQFTFVGTITNILADPDQDWTMTGQPIPVDMFTGNPVDEVWSESRVVENGEDPRLFLIYNDVDDKWYLSQSWTAGWGWRTIITAEGPGGREPKGTYVVTSVSSDYVTTITEFIVS